MRLALCSLAGIIALACGGDPSRGASQPVPSAAPAALAPLPSAAREAQILPKKARVPSMKLIDRRARQALAPDTIGVISRSAAPPRTSSEVYKAVAPATVIIRVPNGIGSGVIIDPAGWIITNHHVVAGGETEAFQITVSVVLGELSKETGAVERGAKTYAAKVYRADKLRDMALIKLEDPPKGLPSVPIAGKNPTPGENVHAIGHAGAGMLWAMKAGEISALGKLSEHLAALAQFKDDAESQEAATQFRKMLDKQQLGLVIQSTCNILPGDSGGPLVNERGEIVGLNAFGRSDPRTGGLISFHVHVEEIRKFIEKPPAKPTRLVPDAWEEGGGDAQYDDADLDGQVDVLLLEGRRPCSYCPRQSATIFVDADQDSYQGRTLPALTDTYEKRDFDAELAYLQIEQDSLIWYDRNNDGRFDTLLVDRGSSGRVGEAYRVGVDGDLEPLESEVGTRPIRAALLDGSALRERFDRVATAAFPLHYVEATTTGGDSLPEPYGSTGSGAVQDLDRDGQPDAVEVSTAFSTRMLIDPDRSFVPQLSSWFEMSKLIGSGLLDAEVSIVTQGSQMWVWYDTDDDGRFDLALVSPQPRLYAAQAAYRVDASGARSPAPEHVGRVLVRPGLLGVPGLAVGLQSIVKAGVLDIMSAEDDLFGSFPDPALDHRGTGVDLIAVAGTKKTVFSIQARGSDGFLLDLDESTFRGKTKIDVPKAVEGGKVDAELAYFQRNGLAWMYYDTNDDGRYDLVLFTTNPLEGKADQAFRIAKDAVTLDNSFAGSPLVRPSQLAKKSLRTKLAKVAPEIFAATMIGE